jgi:hypothetical protein
MIQYSIVVEMKILKVSFLLKMRLVNVINSTQLKRPISVSKTNSNNPNLMFKLKIVR